MMRESVRKTVRIALSISIIVFMVAILPTDTVSAASEAAKKPKATNVQYVMDNGKKTGIKTFTISPFTYANLSQNKVINPDGDSTLKLDDAALLRIAKQEIFPKWGVIAEGIFRDQASQLVTIEGSGMMSSDTSSKTSFDRHFSTGKVSNGYSSDWAVKDLAAYLGSSESKHQGKLCWDEVRVTGPTQIGSLNGARTLMGQELRNCSDDNDISKDEFLGNDYQKNDDKRRLPDLEDDKSGDGFANIVTCVNRAGASGDYDYVSFGVAVYGFDITPVAAENLKYIEAADDDYDVDGQSKKGEDILMGLAGNVDKTGISFHNDREKGTTTYIRNNTTQEVTQSSGLENSVSEESTIGTDDTYEWGMEQEVGVEINVGGWGPGDVIAGSAAPCMFPRATFSMSNSWHELWSTTKSTSETKAATKTKTTNTEVTLPGHTIAVVNQSLENTKTTENYQQPVILSYKVAVFAMSGDYFNGASGGITSSRYDKQWMSVLFDGSDDIYTSGCKALGSLYNRGVINKDTSGYDGAKGKYRSWCDKGAWNSSNKIDWNSISSTLSGDNRPSHRIELSTGKKATTVSDLATELPLLEKAQMLTSKRESITSSVDQIVPLYPLASVNMKSGSKQYELVPRGQQSSDQSNVLHLDPIKVEGFDKDGADFYEFDQSWGKWELLDDKGNVIKDGTAKDESNEKDEVRSGLITLITDDTLGSQRIEVAKSSSDSPSEEQHYIQWKLKEGTGEDGARIISNESLNRSDEEGGPYMTDKEKDEVSTPIVEIDVKDRDKDIENFEVEGSYKGAWDETINLGHYFNVDPVDQSGKVRGVPVYWESKGTSGISVDENGRTSFSKKGTYKVRPYGYDLDDRKIIPRDKNNDPIWFEITAQDKAELSSIVISKPDMDEAETELTEGMTSVAFDLSSYTKFYDQYGDKWEGEAVEKKDEETGEIVTERVFPEIRYSVAPDRYAFVDAEDILTVMRADTYVVTAKAYDSDGNDTGIVIKPIKIDVTEKDRLESITFDEPALTRSERTLKSKDDVVAVKDLKSLIKYIDQDDNEWTGKKPNITFSLGDVGDAAEIKGENFYAYEPGRYTIYANASGYNIDPITVVVLEDADLVLKSENPGRQYLYTEDDQVELELERYIDAQNTFGGKWKGEVPGMRFTLDKAAEGTSITLRTVYEGEDDYEGVDRHYFTANVPGEYRIHVEPEKASEYTQPIDDIIVRVVKGKKVARIEFKNIEDVVTEEQLLVNTHNSQYPSIDLNECLKYYDGFDEEIDPVNDHVKIPDRTFELIDSEEYDEDSYDLTDGTLTMREGGIYFIKATMNVTNFDPYGEDTKEDTILETMTAIPAGDINWFHDFGEWETEPEPTCTEDGIRVKKCKGHDENNDGEIQEDEKCDAEVEDTIPATGHAWDNYYTLDEKGETFSTKCTNCGQANEVTCPAGYKYAGAKPSDGKYYPSSASHSGESCTTDDLCFTVAKDTDTKLIFVPARGHKWDNKFTVINEATCSKTGLEGIKCTECDATREGSEYQREIPKKEHVEDKDGWHYSVVENEDGEQIEEHETCTDFGWKVTGCKNEGCAEQIYELVPPEGHEWDEGKVTTPPTCEQDGIKTYTCSHENCPLKTKEEVLPATGHKWDAGKVTKKATATATGLKVLTCTVCKKTKTVTIPKVVKKANPLKVKAKTAKVKYSKLKKKNQKLKVTKVIKTVKKGQGKVTYTISSAKKGSKSFKKYFKVSKKTGKVTVKKKLKKGTYKVKIKVKAAGNASYKPKTVSVTVKVRVK